MCIRLILFILLTICFGQVQSQSNGCNKFPFYPSDHIRNPSLEKVGPICYTYLASRETPYAAEMSSVIPHWRAPIYDYSGSVYLGKCNGFYIPPQPTVSRLPLVPQPVPDGDGIIGILAGRSEGGGAVQDRIEPKEYISTNLVRILKKDSLYRLNFALGFGTRDTGIHVSFSASPVKFTLFGLADSMKIPFQRPPPPPGILGCLTVHFPDWIPLGSVVISGDPGTWQRGVIDFVAPLDIESIAIGSACDNSDVPYTPRSIFESGEYYFIDDLRFFQASAPQPRLSQIGGGSCEGQSTTLRLQSNNFYNGSAFQWYKNNSPIPETEVALTVSSSVYGPGWYKMRVQNDSVCMMSDSLYLDWAPRIADPFPGRPDTTLCIGDAMELKISGGPAASYLWSTGSTDSSITVTQQGTYSVRVSNACNTLNALKTVMYKDCPPTVFVPNAFTPNGDGLNDIFKASVTGKAKSFSLAVYDRFGQRIFVSNDPSKGWDGTIRSKKQSTGLYIWMLQYTDGSDKTHSEKGTLMLIRQ